MDKINAYCRRIQEKDLEKLMQWRMRPDITKYMNTDPKLTIEGQKKWFERIMKDSELSVEEGRKGFYWLLEVDGVPAGFVSLVNIDSLNQRIHTGVYIAEKAKRSLRLTLDLQWNLYRYSFDVLQMHKVCEEVFAENKAVNRILDMNGSKREGILRDHIYKNGTYHDVVVRGILREEWNQMKQTLQYNHIDFEE